MPELSHPADINRDYIRLLQVMRRFVKEEFAVSIRMTQEDAIEQLLHYAALSRNQVLQEMALELQAFAQDGDQTESVARGETAARRVRYYRGAAIVVEEGTDSGRNENARTSGGGRRIYRGQVVGG